MKVTAVFIWSKSVEISRVRSRSKIGRVSPTILVNEDQNISEEYFELAKGVVVLNHSLQLV